MRSYVLTSARFLTLAVAVMILGGPAILASDHCPETKPVALRGAIDPDGDWIAYSCPEACSSPHDPPVFVRWDWTSSSTDVIYVWCNGINGAPGGEVPIPSTSTCWKCLGSCAGSACPPGELCLPDPGQPRSDCQRYGCDDPAYEPVESFDAQGNAIVICRRKPTAKCPEIISCTPATVVLDGPTAIQPGATCSWSAEAWSGCPASGYTYHWYAANHWVGSGQYYSGGKPSGVLNGYPWRLRVEAFYNGTFAGSQEIEVREDSSAPICMY